MEKLDLAGALVSIDAIGCNPEIAQAIVDADADYLLAVKDNQPTLHAEAKAYFDTAPAAEIDVAETLDKGHGRLEVRVHKVSRAIDWIGSDRSFPGAKRFPKLAVIAMVEARVERKGEVSVERRSYISSRALTAEDFAAAVRSHWRSRTPCTGCSTSPSRRT